MLLVMAQCLFASVWLCASTDQPPSLVGDIWSAEDLSSGDEGLWRLLAAVGEEWADLWAPGVWLPLPSAWDSSVAVDWGWVCSSLAEDLANLG